MGGSEQKADAALQIRRGRRLLQNLLDGALQDYAQSE
jgi:hypothetical protein